MDFYICNDWQQRTSAEDTEVMLESALRRIFLRPKSKKVHSHRSCTVYRDPVGALYFCGELQNAHGLQIHLPENMEILRSDSEAEIGEATLKALDRFRVVPSLDYDELTTPTGETWAEIWLQYQMATVWEEANMIFVQPFKREGTERAANRVGLAKSFEVSARQGPAAIGQAIISSFELLANE